MKTLLMLIALLGLTISAGAQEKYYSKTGHIRFYSHTPMEDIEGNNYQVGTILDVKTGDLMFTALVKAFEFKKALMQEHFNENYMESDKFPKASFQGKINNLAAIDLSKEGVYPAKVAGKLTIHGTTRDVTVDAKLEVKEGKVQAVSQFEVIPGDYAIEIPSLVKDNIAKSILVNVDIQYLPYGK
ncbi:MAG: YceI family protein [Bacteroidales bacterium]